jgi:hypothetical protein
MFDLFLMTTSSRIWGKDLGTGFGDSRNRDMVEATWLIADTKNSFPLGAFDRWSGSGIDLDRWYCSVRLCSIGSEHQERQHKILARLSGFLSDR